MGTDGETEVDIDGRGLDGACDKRGSSRFVGGVCGEEVEGESVEYYSTVSSTISHEGQEGQYPYILPTE